jgi:hypothetical protein
VRFERTRPIELRYTGPIPTTAVRSPPQRRGPRALECTPRTIGARCHAGRSDVSARVGRRRRRDRRLAGPAGGAAAVRRCADVATPTDPVRNRTHRAAQATSGPHRSRPSNTTHTAARYPTAALACWCSTIPVLRVGVAVGRQGYT